MIHVFYIIKLIYQKLLKIINNYKKVGNYIKKF